MKRDGGLEDNVEKCDVSHTPHADASVDIVVLSLAMWGSNCSEYIKEASRVLDSGGRLYIIEPTKRWRVEEDGEEGVGRRLRELLEAHGFHVLKREVDKWLMFDARKK